MTVVIAKWGNSVGVRIPSATLKAAGCAVGNRFYAEVREDNAIVLRPVQKEPIKVDIFAMIDKITPEILPDFSEFDAVLERVKNFS